MGLNMNIRQSITSAIAVLGFAVLGSAALANPIAQTSAPASGTHLAAAESTFTLIAIRGGGRGFRGGGARGFRGGGFRAGGVRGGRAAVVRGGRRGVVVGGRGFAGGRRVGYWRNGRWFGPAAVGVGIGAGGSCYWNCRNSGYGAGYCSANAGNFCY